MKKFEYSVVGALVGAAVGLVLRPCAILVWIAPRWTSLEMQPSAEMVLGLLPAALVGSIVGFVAGMFPRTWCGLLYGGVLSGAAFAAWSLGPLEAWLIDIRFKWDILACFTAAGMLAGLAGSFVSKRRCGLECLGNRQ
jgi:hypothetical protein